MVSVDALGGYARAPPVLSHMAPHRANAQQASSTRADGRTAGPDPVGILPAAHRSRFISRRTRCVDKLVTGAREETSHNASILASTAFSQAHALQPALKCQKPAEILSEKMFGEKKKVTVLFDPEVGSCSPKGLLDLDERAVQEANPPYPK